MHVFETLLPVFIIIGIGFGLRKSDFFSNDFVDGLSKLIYWLALPSLLFYKIAIASYDFTIVGKTACVLTIGMVASMIVGYIAAYFMKLKGGTLGSFVQGTIRANIMYIGLPIVLYYFANVSDADRAKVEAVSILVMAPMIPIYNSLSVIVLLSCQHKFNSKAFGLMGYKIITNPMIVSSIAGFIYSLLFSSMPVVADRVLSAVSQASLPLALLTVGAAMAQSKDTSGWGQATISSMIKIVISPAVGFVAAKLLGLGRIETIIAMIYLACPTATASYILADQLNGDRKLAASIVVICTVLSILSLTAVVWIFSKGSIAV